MSLKINEKAPAFVLPDQDGKPHQLSDWKGQWLLLYFYPKDDTPGCTKEACTLQERLPDFKKAGLEAVGISVDSVKSHRKFADKYKLTFPLLADEKKEVVQLYRVWGKKKFMGKEYLGIARSSFLIDPQGRIAKIYPKVDPAVHAEEVTTDLRNLTAGAGAR
jgi:peroxiredoxin Q/BCP